MLGGSCHKKPNSNGRDHMDSNFGRAIPKIICSPKLATSRQPSVAPREILAERSHSIFLSMWTNLCRGVPVPRPVGSVWHCYALLWRGCGTLVLRLWQMCGTILWHHCSTLCDVVVVHWYTMLWFIFVTLLLYTLWYRRSFSTVLAQLWCWQNLLIFCC